MVQAYTSTVINASAERIWENIRDFNALPDWHPGIIESRVETDELADKIGCVRVLNLKDGGFIRERLLALSDYEYTCTYSILESPMGVDNYIATLKLTPITDGNPAHHGPEEQGHARAALGLAQGPHFQEL